MSEAIFRQFRRQVLDLYGQGEWSQALDLIEQQGDRFPEHAFHVENWRICMLALMGEPESAIENLRQAVEAGHWWAETDLRGDPDLASLQGDGEFELLVELCRQRHIQARAASKRELELFFPSLPEGQAAPLLIALHGRNHAARTFAEDWKGLTSDGWIVAVPQSSQVLGSGAYGWDDLDQGAEEIITHYRTLLEEYPVDPQRVVLAGFSQGGGLAIWLAVRAQVPAQGFLAVAPSFRDLEALQELGGPVPAGTRGYLITGGQDVEPEKFDRIEALMEECGIRCRREHHPDLGHTYPENFDESLQNALRFLVH